MSALYIDVRASTRGSFIYNGCFAREEGCCHAKMPVLHVQNVLEVFSSCFHVCSFRTAQLLLRRGAPADYWARGFGMKAAAHTRPDVIHCFYAGAPGPVVLLHTHTHTTILHGREFGCLERDVPSSVVGPTRVHLKKHRQNTGAPKVGRSRFTEELKPQNL